MKQNETGIKEKYQGLLVRCNELDEVFKKQEKESVNKDLLIKELINEIEIYKSNFLEFEENFNKLKIQFEEEEKLNKILKNENKVFAMS